MTNKQSTLKEKIYSIIRDIYDVTKSAPKEYYFQQIIQEVRKHDLAEIEKKRKSMHHFFVKITHADDKLKEVQARSMELGYDQAMYDIRAYMKGEK